MSLQVDDGGRRARSRSPSGRSSSTARVSEPRIAHAPYPGDEEDVRHTTRIPDYDDADVEYSSSGRRDKEYRYEKERERSRSRVRDDLDKERHRLAGEDKLSFLPAKYAKKVSSDRDDGRDEDRDRPRSSHRHRSRSRDRARDEDDLTYGSGTVPSGRRTPSVYTVEPSGSHLGRDSVHEEKKHYRSHSHDPRSSGSNILTVEPDYRSSRGRSSSPAPPLDTGRLSVVNLLDHAPRLSNLSVSNAPGSPLLESYHGTYQSMSPMPSPMLLASQIPRIPSPASEEDVILSPGASISGADKMRRRARFYDVEADAHRLAKALKGERHPPDISPLIEVLPGLMHDQVMELRGEYKHIVKTGPERRGVNLAKHIKARLKDEDPALMKACYTVALGRWESEAYWANFWYHGDKTRRELLIESLMGRTNEEIRRIKDGFSDKKYDDSLTKCMRTELKEDKFKRAVLFVLDEQRMNEYDRDGRPLPLDQELVLDDASCLRYAVNSDRGSESAMINIVVQRSDAHLREVLRHYSNEYNSNFARDCLKKSGNLVGEMLAHILNGVINKPVRDAALVHHALTASKRDELRRELLISRLVRFHWDRHHMSDVKVAYRSRYGRDMQEAVRDATGHTDWGMFCCELCITRHPDEVKRVERVDIHHDRH